MALHQKVDDHVIENLKEFLKLAEIGLSTLKADLEGDMAKDTGCLGAPAAVLLFSIIDAIGSYHRKDRTLKIKNHRRPFIDDDGYVQFFILNSHYFGQDLTGQEVIYFYGQYRSNLIHNAAVNAGMLIYNKEESEVFPKRNGVRVVNLHALFNATRDALRMFIEASQNVIAGSRVAKSLKPALQASGLKPSDSSISPTGYVDSGVFISAADEDIDH